MGYLIDTNTAILFINGRSQEVKNRLLSTPPQDVFLCSIVVAELLAGAAKSDSPERSAAKQKRFIERFLSWPFDDAAAPAYAEIRADLERKGTPIGANDLLIAAIAKTRRLTVITNNRDEFNRVVGLRVEDWSTEQKS